MKSQDETQNRSHGQSSGSQNVVEWNSFNIQRIATRWGLHKCLGRLVQKVGAVYLLLSFFPSCLLLFLFLFYRSYQVSWLSTIIKSIVLIHVHHAGKRRVRVYDYPATLWPTENAIWMARDFSRQNEMWSQGQISKAPPPTPAQKIDGSQFSSEIGICFFRESNEIHKASFPRIDHYYLSSELLAYLVQSEEAFSSFPSQ